MATQINLNVSFIPNTASSNGCHIIYAGVINNITGLVTNWTNTTVNVINVGTPFTQSVSIAPPTLTNNDLAQCGVLKVMVIVIPCCAFLPGLPPSTPPSPLPTSAAVQTISIPNQQPIVNTCQRYVVPFNTATNIVITNAYSCLSPITPTSINTTLTNSGDYNGQTIEVCALNGAVFTGALPVTTKPYNNGECCYQCVNYTFSNLIGSPVTIAGYYQDSTTGNIVSWTPVAIPNGSFTTLSNVVQGSLILRAVDYAKVSIISKNC